MDTIPAPGTGRVPSGMTHRMVRFMTPLLQVMYRWYLRKPRLYRYKSLKVLIDPDVFYPGFIVSTRLFLEYLDQIDHHDLNFLDLGSGSGILALLAAQKGAVVTASDINPHAVRNIRDNAFRLQIPMEVVQSDLFENLEGRLFDRIVVTPPYYPREPHSYKDMAWYCGRNFEYYERLFPQLRNHMSPYAEVLMILSQDCDLDRIRGIARKSHFEFALVSAGKKLGEWNFIFRIF